MSEQLGRLAGRGRRGWWVATIVVAAMLAGGGARVVDLLRHGRGQPRAAIAYLARETFETVIHVGVDGRGRTSLVLTYFAPTRRTRPGRESIDAGQAASRSALPPGRVLSVVSAARVDGAKPSWWIVERMGFSHAPVGDVVSLGGQRYKLRATFTAAPLSGATWHVYSRIGGDSPR